LVQTHGCPDLACIDSVQYAQRRTFQTTACIAKSLQKDRACMSSCLNVAAWAIFAGNLNCLIYMQWTAKHMSRCHLLRIVASKDPNQNQTSCSHVSYKLSFFVPAAALSWLKWGRAVRQAWGLAGWWDVVGLFKKRSRWLA